MPAARGRQYVIRDVKAVRLLGSPLRQALLDWIAARGPATVAELSDHLGKPADRLYYHVRLLERAGLLVAEETQATNGRSEARFDVPGRPLVLEYQPASPSNRRAVRRVIAGVLRSARSDFDHAIADADVRVDGPSRELWAGRMEALLTPDDLETVNDLLKKIFRLMQESSAPAPDAKPYQLSWVLSPVTRR